MDREEALKKVRQMSLPKETMEILQALAPELTESEDERIRKNLKDFLRHIANGEMNDRGTMPSAEKCQKWITYLEKQKDRKPEIRVKIPKFRVGDIIQRIPLEKWDSSKKIVSIDECGYNYDLSHLGDTISGGAIGFAFENEYELVEQKPAEWSEEEKEILDNILSHYVLIDKPTDANGISKEKYISLIKSIRFDTYKNCNSHWKPSEEQMKALNEIVNILAESPFLHQNDYLFNILNGLREELKKLL